MSKALTNSTAAIIALASGVALYATGRFAWILAVAIAAGLFFAMRTSDRS